MRGTEIPSKGTFIWILEASAQRFDFELREEARHYY